MHREAAREELLNRVFELEPQEFEHLSKILVEQIEQPPDIELTPFHGDGGIDIRGAIGRKMYSAKFGVQVKRYENSVGTPAMRGFLGAISQHDYQFGSFITSSDFNSGAIEIAKSEVSRPITLVNGERLTELLLSRELGVVDRDGYAIDEEFWGIFGTSSDDADLVKSDAVPQADSIGVIGVVLRGIDEGYRVKPRIREYMIAETGEGWDPRQADYYPQAAWALGYLHKDAETEYQGRKMRQWGLTRDGEEYLRYWRDDERRAHEDFIEHIRDTDIIQRVLGRLKDERQITHDELAELIREESELNGTTATRRRATVATWLEMLSEVRQFRDGHSYKYEFVG